VTDGFPVATAPTRLHVEKPDPNQMFIQIALKLSLPTTHTEQQASRGEVPIAGSEARSSVLMSSTAGSPGCAALCIAYGVNYTAAARSLELQPRRDSFRKHSAPI
jgi:hypothetical protein